MKKLDYIFTCDICRENAKNDIDKPPVGWVEISVQNKFVDRDFTDKHICDECSLIVKQKHEAA